MTEREEIIERLRGAELSKRSVFNLEHVVAAIDGHDIYEEWTFDECKQLRDKLIDLLTSASSVTSDRHITDELRKWLDKYTMRKDTYDEMVAIIDRIDIAHDEALSKVYMDMSDSEWVRLPKDADGEPIHIGDVVDNTHKDGFTAKLVIGISYREDEVYVRVDEDKLRWHTASKLHHHKQPTVEDTLRQFLGECEHASMLGYTDMPQDIFDTYAAKLRLVGDVE